MKVNTIQHLERTVQSIDRVLNDGSKPSEYAKACCPDTVVLEADNLALLEKGLTRTKLHIPAHMV